MLKMRSLSILLFLLTLTGIVFSQPTLEINAKKATLELLDSRQFKTYLVEGKQKTLVEASWSIEPATLGSFAEPGLLMAEEIGTGTIYAQHEDLIASIPLEIKEPDIEDDEETIIGPKVVIENSDVELFIDDLEQFTALYYDESGTAVEATFEWSISDPLLGSIDETGLFQALLKGKLLVYARVGEEADSVQVSIDKVEEDEQDEKLCISPKDTTIITGSVIELSASFCEEPGGTPVPATPTWSIMTGTELASITEAGELTALQPGICIVLATLDEYQATSAILIVEEIVDDGVINTIELSRMMPDGKELPASSILEGESLVIGGLPHPLNILNGTSVYFPPSSLNEDIKILISLPDAATVDELLVDLGAGIFGGIQFTVLVDGTPVEPYYFNQPVTVSIPFKRGLIKNFGIDPSWLSLFYAQDGDFTDSGISGVVVDEISNRIYSQVAHFSTLVVRQQPTTAVAKGQHTTAKAPTQLALEQNYPNPFNPSTVIKYHVPEDGFITLAIYDLLGHEKAILTNSHHTAGSYAIEWNGKDKNGLSAPSGTFFYRLKSAHQTLTGKMVLLK